MARSINPENYEKVPGDKKGRYQLKTNHSHTISNRKYREAQTGKTLEQQRDIHYQSLSAHEVNKRSNKRTAYTQHLDEFVTAYNQRQTPENRITKTQARQMGLFQKEHQFRVRQEKVEPIVRAE